MKTSTGFEICKAGHISRYSRVEKLKDDDKMREENPSLPAKCNVARTPQAMSATLAGIYINVTPAQAAVKETPLASDGVETFINFADFGFENIPSSQFMVS